MADPLVGPPGQVVEHDTESHVANVNRKIRERRNAAPPDADQHDPYDRRTPEQRARDDLAAAEFARDQEISEWTAEVARVARIERLEGRDRALERLRPRVLDHGIEDSTVQAFALVLRLTDDNLRELAATEQAERDRAEADLRSEREAQALSVPCPVIAARDFKLGTTKIKNGTWLDLSGRFWPARRLAQMFTHGFVVPQPGAEVQCETARSVNDRGLTEIPIGPPVTRDAPAVASQLVTDDETPDERRKRQNRERQARRRARQRAEKASTA